MLPTSSSRNSNRADAIVGPYANLTNQQAAQLAYAAAMRMKQRRALWAKGSRDFAVRFRNFSLEPSWFHDEWYAALDDETLRSIYLTAPREHAKTSVVLTWVERLICENHHLRVGLISGTDPLAKKFLGELKQDLTHNDDLRRIYNNGRSFVGPTWTEHELVLADARQGPRGIKGKDVSVFAIGRGGQISSRHCDVLIVDDVESKDSVNTDELRQSTREWWSREVVPVLSKGGKMVVLGTRKHYDDLYAYLIADPTYHKVMVAKSVFREDGSPIWPEMWDADSLAVRKAQLDSTDVLAWPQEYLNEPRPSENQMFYPEQWPTYSKLPFGLTYYQYWDLAISEREVADFTVGVCIGVDDHNNAYLVELRRGHWNFNRQMSEIEDMGNKWNGPQSGGTLSTIGIEQVAYQAVAVQESMRRTMLPIIGVPRSRALGAKKSGPNDKVTHARLLEARAAGKKVYRAVETPMWWPTFVQELVYFPDGAHDDQVDALSGAVHLAGFEASSVAWAYGVWTCANCGHMFSWEAGRACPKCNTKAPDEFLNPELEGVA